MEEKEFDQKMKDLHKKLEDIRLQGVLRASTDVEKEYYKEHYYEDKSYCEACDSIVEDGDFFWYDTEENTDYLHIDCHLDEYKESLIANVQESWIDVFAEDEDNSTYYESTFWA